MHLYLKDKNIIKDLKGEYFINVSFWSMAKAYILTRLAIIGIFFGFLLVIAILSVIVFGF